VKNAKFYESLDNVILSSVSKPPEESPKLQLEERSNHSSSLVKRQRRILLK